MKNLSICLLLLFSSPICIAQKPIIDTSVFGKWPSLNQPGISGNGKYMNYTITNQPSASYTLVVKSVNDKWRLEIPEGRNASFDETSKHVFYLVKDSLVIQQLGSNKRQIIPQVIGYRTFLKESRDWLAIQKINVEEQTLVLKDLKTDEAKEFPGVLEYFVSPSGTKIILKVLEKSSKTTQSLIWLDLNTGRQKMFWQGSEAHNITFDNAEKQTCFLVSTEKDGLVNYTIGYYGVGDPKAVELANDQQKELKGRQIAYGVVFNFSKDNQRLFFDLEKPKAQTLKSDAELVNVWSYQDPKLQSHQRYKQPNVFSRAVINLADRKIISLMEEDETLAFFSLQPPKEHNDSFILTEKIEGDPSEWYWNPTARQTVYLISTGNGERRVLKADAKYAILNLEISPSGRFVIYFDPEFKNYFSYEVQTGKVRSITGGIATTWNPYYLNYLSNPQLYPVGTAGWLEKDQAVLIYDENDLWQIDPEGINAPKKLTNGKENSIIFKLISTSKNKRILSSDKTWYFKTFAQNTKDCGFYSLTLSGGGKLNKLYGGAFQFSSLADPYANISFEVEQAKHADVYLLTRQSSSSFPNYFITHDFKSFKDVTNLHPERKYNWLKTELHTYKLPNGKISQGILYKPENFDPKKKYPIIFNYYTEISYTLNKFPQPDPNGATINIPHFVSNGYLVFQPDIHSEVGKIGDGALTSVLAAVSHLKKMPWIDSIKMGINGHSLGGFETNYIITHTDQFAAAVTAAGPSDWVGMYGNTWGQIGSSQQNLLEIGYVNMGGSLWTKQENYLNNSPILLADKVATPLLMMHNKNDNSVPFSQGLEFFNALRRLRKKVWLLEYDNENHMIRNPKNQLDYEMRLKQFFDYYLLNQPAPEWMTKGSATKDKEVQHNPQGH